MKAAEIREQTDEELAQTCREIDKELEELKIKSGIGDSTGEQPLKVRSMRRDYARVQTVLTERARAANQQS